MRTMLTVITLICLSSAVSIADEPLATPAGTSVAATTASSMLYYIGTTHYRDGDYSAALENFALSWELTRDEALAYDAALCAWRLDQPFRARVWLRRASLKRAAHSRLQSLVVAAIAEDDDAFGRDFRCSVTRRQCAWSTRWAEMTATERGDWKP